MVVFNEIYTFESNALIPGVVLDSSVFITTDTAHEPPGYDVGTYQVLSGYPRFYGPVSFSMDELAGVIFTLGFLDRLGTVLVRGWETPAPNIAVDPPRFSWLSDFLRTNVVTIPVGVRYVRIESTNPDDPAGFSVDNLQFFVAAHGRLRVKVTDGDGLEHWKFAQPKPGENGGLGKLKVKRTYGWVDAKGGIVQ